MQLESSFIQREEKYYKEEKIKYILLISFGILAILTMVIISLCVGNYKTTPLEVLNALIDRENNAQVFNIVIYSRMPRLLASLFVGASLSIAGFCYQSIFKNKMASPDLLGVSAGASAGAVVAILLNFSFAFISLFSFIGGVIAVVITAFIARLFKGVNYSISLLLSGIVVAGFMNSFVGIAKSVSNMSQLASITYWLLGGFYNARYEQLVIVCPIIFVCIVCLILLRWKIVMLQNSDEDAQSHGINVKRVRAAVIILSTLITALSVAISGTVGWIGLAIPNLINLIVKNDSKKTIILSVIIGSLFACICDLLCRTLTTSEIPVGILTGIFGAIIFIVVLIVRRVQNG